MIFQKEFFLRLAVFLLSSAFLAVTLIITGAVPGSITGSGKDPLSPAEIESVPKSSKSIIETGFYHIYTDANPYYEEPFCIQCHNSPPHERSTQTRAMLNHHSSRMHCMVCHGLGFITLSKDISFKEKMLWPSIQGQWLEPDREKSWRESITEKNQCFSPGPQCIECHRHESILDYENLGYDEIRSEQLRDLEEFIIRTPMQKWFFPSIL